MPVTLFRMARSLLLALGLALAAGAFAANEPTVAQIYDTAQAGKVTEAQAMIEQVLRAHPKSAKAHFVQAELFAVQGRLPDARKSLGKAEALAPGLPFAKPAAVASLRERLAQGKPAAQAGGTGSLAADAGIAAAGRDVPAASPAPARVPAAVPVEPHTGGGGSNVSAWKVALIAAGLGLIWFLWRRRPTPPQNFGAAPMAPAGYPPGSPMAPGGVAQPGPGVGSGVLGGLATGLAVGAGVVAAEQIGRRLFEHDRPVDDRDRGASGGASSASGGGFVPMDANADMGGSNFGISDAGSWDDGGGGASDGGSDWDT